MPCKTAGSQTKISPRLCGKRLPRNLAFGIFLIGVCFFLPAHAEPIREDVVIVKPSDDDDTSTASSRSLDETGQAWPGAVEPLPPTPTTSAHLGLSGTHHDTLPSAAPIGPTTGAPVGTSSPRMIPLPATSSSWPVPPAKPTPAERQPELMLVPTNETSTVENTSASEMPSSTPRSLPNTHVPVVDNLPAIERRTPTIQAPDISPPVSGDWAHPNQGEEVIYAPSDIEDAPMPSGRSQSADQGATSINHAGRPGSPEIIRLDVIPSSPIDREAGTPSAAPRPTIPIANDRRALDRPSAPALLPTSRPRMTPPPSEPVQPELPLTPSAQTQPASQTLLSKPEPTQTSPSTQAVSSTRTIAPPRENTYVLSGRLVFSGDEPRQIESLSGIRIEIYERGTDFLDANQLVSSGDVLDVFVTDANGFFVSGEISTADGFFMGTSDPVLVAYRAIPGNRPGRIRHEPVIFYHTNNIAAGEHDLGVITISPR